MKDKPHGSYRDDLSAALARTSSLEKQLQEANEKISELKAPPTPKKPKPKRRITVVRNSQYFPLWGTWLSGISSASHPRLPRPQDRKYGSVIGAILNTLILTPLGHILRVLYFLHLYLLVAPWTLFLSTLLSIPLLVFLVLRGIRFSDAPRPKPILQDVEGTEYLWVLLSCLGQPLLPLFAFGWKGGHPS